MATLGVFRDDFYNVTCTLPQQIYVTSTQNGGAILASLLTGATEVYVAFSGQTTAQALTTDTAANIVNTMAGLLPRTSGNPSWFLQIINNNTTSGAITLTGGTGVTISGTNTIAINTCREFIVTITSPTTVTLQNVGSGTN